MLPVSALRIVLHFCASEFRFRKCCSREQNRFLLSSKECLVLLDGLLLFNMGLVDEVGDRSLGELLGLNESPLNDELIISIGRKHWASGLNVEVTSRSALLSSNDSCLCSEYKIWMRKHNLKQVAEGNQKLFYLNGAFFANTIRNLAWVNPNRKLGW